MLNKIGETFTRKNLSNTLVIIFTLVLIFSWVGIFSTTLSDSVSEDNLEINNIEPEKDVFLSGPPLQSPSVAIPNLIIALLGVTLVITTMGIFENK
ncbi:hypothetical protein HOD61_00405 [archaeon]|jgi:hypothetical protein|nr:hypothetical protein [archaeon]